MYSILNNICDATLQVNFSSDGKFLASASTDCTVVVWRMSLNRAEKLLFSHHATFMTGFAEPAYSVSFFPQMMSALARAKRAEQVVSALGEAVNTGKKHSFFYDLDGTKKKTSELGNGPEYLLAIGTRTTMQVVRVQELHVPVGQKEPLTQLLERRGTTAPLD